MRKINLMLVGVVILFLTSGMANAGLTQLRHVCEDDANGVVHCDYNWNE